MKPTFRDVVPSYPNTNSSIFEMTYIDQASAMRVPSMKFNWRGEPLLNSKLSDYIKYAKKKGILETIINTNATNLNRKNSEKLIDAGLDMLIYSFDTSSTKDISIDKVDGTIDMDPRFSPSEAEVIFVNTMNVNAEYSCRAIKR